MVLDLEKIKKSKSTEELLHFGIINLDKPSGPTSFSVSNYIRKSLKLTKTSHGGTLDPLVTGVLPVMLSRACRLSEYLMHRNKTYVGIMQMHKEIGKEDLEKIIKKFIGKIMQLPPKRSRVKRAIREREIVSFNILEIFGKDVLFESEVQAGTYIRKLCDDIGREIGGAHMLELRRTKAGIFSEPSITLHEFDKAVEEYHSGNDIALRNMITPGEIIKIILPVVHIKKQVVKKALTGSPIFPKFLENTGEIKNLEIGEKICIFSEEKLIGCYSFIGAENIVAKPEFVFN